MSEYENFNDPLIYIKNKNSDISSETLFNKYLKLLDTYHQLFKKNIVTKNNYYREFIYLQGMKCLGHVFTILMQYTGNIPFTYYHCEKGIYYFTEFISQIENENSFLKLNSIDAIIFVYKKTIYNINKKLVDITKKQSVDETNNLIKILINLNKYEYYEKLNPLFIKLLHTEKDLGHFEIKVNDCHTLNTLVEAFKNEL